MICFKKQILLDFVDHPKYVLVHLKVQSRSEVDVFRTRGVKNLDNPCLAY